MTRLMEMLALISFIATAIGCERNHEHVVPEVGDSDSGSTVMVGPLDFDVEGIVNVTNKAEFFVEGEYGEIEVNEHLPTATFRCPKRMDIKVNKGVLSYSLQPETETLYAKDEVDRCALYYRSALDELMLPRAKNAMTYK